MRRICHLNEKCFGGKSYVARQTRDVAKEATFKHFSLVCTPVADEFHREYPQTIPANSPRFPESLRFFIKSPGLSERLMGDFRGLFLDIVFTDILTMQRFLEISRFLYSGGWLVCQTLFHVLLFLNLNRYMQNSSKNKANSDTRKNKYCISTLLHTTGLPEPKLD